MLSGEFDFRHAFATPCDADCTAGKITKARSAVVIPNGIIKHCLVGESASGFDF